MSTMKIVADENIPYVREFFKPFGDVYTAPGRRLSPVDVVDADILVTRSVTQVNERLLAGSKVQFVGTCTIGTDHMDLDYLLHRNIAHASAPGCNAGGVLQYVLAALYHVEPSWTHKKIGVVGHGNVGGKVCAALHTLNADFCAYDPFLKPDKIPYLVDLEEILKCDIVCMHTPYTTGGAFPTHHMMSTSQLLSLPPDAILLNAGRGGAIDNVALHKVLQTRQDLKVILDVWEREPEVDKALMSQVTLATPHIAGYSYEGKLLGSAMIFRALVKHLNLCEKEFNEHLNALMEQFMGVGKNLNTADLRVAIEQSYKIDEDDKRMRDALESASQEALGKRFDQLRKNYPQRREFQHYRLQGLKQDLIEVAKGLGFNCGE